MESLANFDIVTIWKGTYPFLKSLIFLILIFFLLDFVGTLVHKTLLKKAHTKHQRSNIEIFSKFLKYFFFLAALGIVLLKYASSLKEFGIVFGALTAAIGFALQKPISAIAAWVMVIIKRPFEIGDRVIIGQVKGNVVDISLTHIYLEEVGRYGGEEVSGRTIIIPNSKLFEEDVINYSLQDDFILGQVIFTVTHESNLDRAIEIARASARKWTDEYNKIKGKEEHTRLEFSPNGVDIHARYYVPFSIAQEVATSITKDILIESRISDDIEISYPHTKLIFNNKDTSM